MRFLIIIMACTALVNCDRNQSELDSSQNTLNMKSNLKEIGVYFDSLSDESLKERNGESEEFDSFMQGMDSCVERTEIDDSIRNESTSIQITSGDDCPFYNKDQTTNIRSGIIKGINSSDTTITNDLGKKFFRFVSSSMEQTWTDEDLESTATTLSTHNRSVIVNLLDYGKFHFKRVHQRTRELIDSSSNLYKITWTSDHTFTLNGQTITTRTEGIYLTDGSSKILKHFVNDVAVATVEYDDVFQFWESLDDSFLN